MPMNVNLVLGKPGTIPCNAEGESTPVIRWVRGEALNLVSRLQVVDGDLQFSTAEFTDRGNYTCVASSDQGVINVTVAVDVIG